MPAIGIRFQRSADAIVNVMATANKALHAATSALLLTFSRAATCGRSLRREGLIVGRRQARRRRQLFSR
jgi:hypothetical protein